MKKLTIMDGPQYLTFILITFYQVYYDTNKIFIIIIIKKIFFIKKNMPIEFCAELDMFAFEIHAKIKLPCPPSPTH